MNGPNHDYLLEQFRIIEEYLGRARGIAGLSEQDYLGDLNLVDASIRQLTVLFETCHNIGKHLVASYGWRASTTKAETFEILAEQGILSQDLLLSFQDAARFRNLVTYQTAVVQNTLVFQVLRENLGDFERFLTSVSEWLEAHRA